MNVNCQAKPASFTSNGPEQEVLEYRVLGPARHAPACVTCEDISCLGLIRFLEIQRPKIRCLKLCRHCPSLLLPFQCRPNHFLDVVFQGPWNGRCSRFIHVPFEEHRFALIEELAVGCIGDDLRV